MKNRKVYSIYLSAIMTFMISGCDIMSERLENVGRLPELTKPKIYEDPTFDPKKAQIEAAAQLSYSGYQPDGQPQFNSNRGNDSRVFGHSPEWIANNTNDDSSLSRQNANSIWNPNSRSFFKSRRVGDVLSVVVSVQDQAQINNNTQKSRQSGSKMGMPSLFGLEKAVNEAIPGAAGNLVDLSSKSSSAGSGKINRQEVISTTIAATIVRILPTGNLVIRGSQEVRVNFEIREVLIEGIVRPEDIANNNTIQLSQVAEARVSYGGRGQIFEYQQDPYGKQVADIVNPF